MTSDELKTMKNLNSVELTFEDGQKKQIDKNVLVVMGNDENMAVKGLRVSDNFVANTICCLLQQLKRSGQPLPLLLEMVHEALCEEE